MDTSQILSIFLKGAIGSRGRKRARKAARFLGGNKGFLSASTILGAAGVAWGIYETVQNSGKSTGQQPGQTPGSSSGGGFGPAVGGTNHTPPPIPGQPPPAAGATTSAASFDDSALPPEALRLVRLAVSAARADGTLLPAERALILGHAREAGVESTVEAELASPRPLAELVAGITDLQRKRDLYTLAFTIVRADEHISGGERVYLAQLAHQLGLDTGTVATIEADTAARIDATPE